MIESSGISECYAAFERLKARCPRSTKFIGLSLDKITASVVSQEANFDSGYLKKRRPSHQTIIALIESFKKEQQVTTLSKTEIQRREKNNTLKYKNERDRLQLLLEQSLARELLLAAKIHELETQVYSLSNLTKIKRKSV